MEVKINDDNKLSIRLFTEVKNTPELRKSLERCCLIKPSLILDPFCIIIAANKAIMSETITTHSVYTEILFNLSISKNIKQSLERFSVDDTSTELLAVTINDTGENMKIDGIETDLNELKRYTDVDLIKKCYKLNDDEMKDAVACICNKIAVKDL